MKGTFSADMSGHISVLYLCPKDSTIAELYSTLRTRPYLDSIWRISGAYSSREFNDYNAFTEARMGLVVLIRIIVRRFPRGT